MMAELSEVAPIHWVVLVGIDYYVKDRCLQGCVRDVTGIQHTLNQLKSPAPVNAFVFTATTPPDRSIGYPLEDSTAWPTYDNIIGALNTVKDRSRPGDLVYIHYSGHGTRLSSGQMALVLYDPDPRTPYASFPGRLLGRLLQRLSAKGVLATLVLDCCFSGGILRGENLQGVAARSIDYNLYSDARAAQEVNTLLLEVDDHARRNSSIHPDDWLVNPEGYVILSATSPHETAWEMVLKQTGEPRGALTYFLILALNGVRNRDSTPTVGAIYQHLHALFHVHWPRQTPMRYGNQEMVFFGQLRLPPADGFVSILKADDGKLCLAAGEAHNVQVGDEYAIYPFDFGPSSQSREPPITARVAEVQPLTSELVEIGRVHAHTRTHEIETGWKAKLVTAFPRQCISAGLSRAVRDDLLFSDTREQYPYLHLSALEDGEEGPACTFNVTVNQRNEYEILDGSHHRIWSLPTIPRGGTKAHEAALGILQQLAKFKYIEGIENRTPDPTFEKSFSLLTVPAPEPAATGSFEVGHGDEWGLVIENRGEANLYVAMLNLGPSWQIVDLFSDAYMSGFIVIPPKSTSTWEGAANKSQEEVRLRMEVPETLRGVGGLNRCEDVIKVFVTNTATSFSPLTLPEIPLDAKDLIHNTPQGYRNSDDQLTDFLQVLASGSQSRGGPSHWATRTFIVLTTFDLGKG
ncbi:hypothetical protein DL771_005815 [Monosporascus sp. 5C6A]|nr:hypothetical protein DL771_005815 [Monosporascus sp. 5C6A]